MISDMAFYLRAHKKEPMMIPSLIGAILAGASTWFLGAAYGPTGAAAGFLALVIVWGLPSCYVVFAHCRKKWHNNASLIESDQSATAIVL
jgi:O-antigen/teichoic acid export membrane protein